MDLFLVKGVGRHNKDACKEFPDLIDRPVGRKVRSIIHETPSDVFGWELSGC
jgi:hypothetical protein